MTTLLWNKSRIIGQKRLLQLSHIWGIRIRLKLEGKLRDLALFNMALNSRLRGCELVKLKVSSFQVPGRFFPTHLNQIIQPPSHI